MDNLDPDDLRTILSEQQELRLRLVALDRKIDALRAESLKPSPTPRPSVSPAVRARQTAPAEAAETQDLQAASV